MSRVDMCHGQVTWFLETHEKNAITPMKIPMKQGIVFKTVG